MCGSSPVFATENEILGVFSNDSLFDSDGSGVTGSLELAAKLDKWSTGCGIYVATPELLNEKRRNEDPLAKISRLTLWLGKTSRWEKHLDTQISGRLGLEGGVADDIGFFLQDVAHEWIGKGSRNLESSNDKKGVIGVSGWARALLADWQIRTQRVGLSPYGHASLGNDTIEVGVGLAAVIQSNQETVLPPLSLPKNGSYVPAFGGDGLTLYNGGRGIALETLYDELQNPIIGEIGIIGQLTFFGAFRLGAGLSCTTTPYEGAIGSDCKTDLRVSYAWPSAKEFDIE